MHSGSLGSLPKPYTMEAMTSAIEQMLRAELRDLKLQLAKHQRTILAQMETIAALNRQIVVLGRVVEKKDSEK